MQGGVAHLAHFIEPATILTVSIAAVYLIGWSYLGGYLQRVGILPEPLYPPKAGNEGAQVREVASI
jgi:hypothetical protein